MSNAEQLDDYKGFILNVTTKSKGPDKFGEIESLTWEIRNGEKPFFFFDAHKKHLYINDKVAKELGIAVIYANRPWKEICEDKDRHARS